MSRTVNYMPHSEHENNAISSQDDISWAVDVKVPMSSSNMRV